MRGIAVSTTLVIVAAFALFAAAVGGARPGSRAHVPCPSAPVGYVMVDQDPVQHNDLDPELMTTCSYYFGGVISDEGRHTVEIAWIVRGGDGELSYSCRNAVGTPARVLGSKTRVAAVDVNFKPSPAWLKTMASSLKAAEALAKRCPPTGKHVLSFGVSASAFGANKSGIPALAQYTFSTLNGSGTITVNYDWTKAGAYQVTAPHATIRISHHYRFARNPTITLTVTSLSAIRGRYRTASGGGKSVTFRVKAVASSLAVCKGAVGDLTFSSSAKTKGIVSLALGGRCKSRFVVADKVGVTGNDATSRVTVRIGA